MKKKKLIRKLVLPAAALAVSAGVYMSAAASVQTSSPYVTLSPDGLAWTTNAGDQNYEQYDGGTTITTGIASSLRSLNEGEHYYKVSKTGAVPVGKWVVEHPAGQCIHDDYPGTETAWHGLTYREQKCLASYYSGWIAYCADCGEPIGNVLIYMSKAAAQSITEIDTSLDYYYICPFCTNLEQGHGFEHECKDISWNRYTVEYMPNGSNDVSGYMGKSIHMYNNANTYNGEAIAAQTRLSLNSYARIGYEFSGWNTEPDGSGQSFADGEEILNLSTENEGTVTLYAQWKRSTSTLRIDPAGGTYDGNAGITSVVQEYGTTYTVDTSKLVAPMGPTVTFNSMGGSTVASKSARKLFQSFQMSSPFYGRYKNNKYVYTAANGKTDTLTAQYDFASITLPSVTRSGYSFAGWYYDAACTNHAGLAGDTITPTQNMTLYAKWVGLILNAVDNYNIYGGKGAVDLTWSQPDGQDKTYKIYQSRDKVTWSQISSAQDIGAEKTVNKYFSYSGQVQTYTVPYSGMYEFTLNGAQGGNFGTYSGGYGGRITARVWLNAGEVVTYNIGGQNGYNGGGSATSYGNGGGRTTVSTSRLGTFLVAGGGGGVSAAGNGGAGGAETSLTTTAAGAAGMAGGGAGYLGGNAGEYIVHTHTDDCYKTEDTSFVLINQDTSYLSTWAQSYFAYGQDLGGNGYKYDYAHTGDYYAQSTSEYKLSNHSKGTSGGLISLGRLYYMEEPHYRYMYIPTNNNEYLNLHLASNYWSEDGGCALQGSCITVYNQNEEVIFYKSLEELPRATTGQNDIDVSYDAELNTMTGGGKKGTSSAWAEKVVRTGEGTNTVAQVYWNEKVTIPEGTTGIRIEYYTYGDNIGWFTHEINEIDFEGSITTLICGMTEGQVIDSKPAYGGSNYAADNVASFTSEQGKQIGNGNLTIKSVQVGFSEALEMDGVAATDYAAPDKVDINTVDKQAGSGTKVTVSWQKPADNGTTYYHKAESYKIGDINVLSTSNITKNTLTSGVKGYHYVIDTISGTQVTTAAPLLRSPSIDVVLTSDVQYLHVATVDVAGNLSGTIHIPIGKLDTEVEWPVLTDPISISTDKDNIYQKSDREYYVRADGVTPFMLTYRGYIDGTARTDYQVTRMIFDTEDTAAPVTGETRNRMEIMVSGSTTITNTTINYSGGDINRGYTGQIQLGDGGYTTLERSGSCKVLKVQQKFTMDGIYDGHTIYVIPVAGADTGNDVVYSDFARDKTNGIYLIADGVGPDISNTDVFEGLDVIHDGNRQDLTFTAKDNTGGSGLRDFWAVITNTDNMTTEVVYADENGVLVLPITSGKAVYNGDFTVEFHAVDNVGNETVEIYGTTQFSLEVTLERCLEPHDDPYRAGESGILTITTYGYAQKVVVEFPDEFLALNPDMNKVYVYDPAKYVSVEELKFMVPLYTPEGTGYKIKVTAYKNSATLEDYPELSVIDINGSVLEQIRTRLR